MTTRMDTQDPDILGSLPALRRAAHRARRLAIRTGTPCYIMRGGKIVNIAIKRRGGGAAPLRSQRQTKSTT